MSWSIWPDVRVDRLTLIDEQSGRTLHVPAAKVILALEAAGVFPKPERKITCSCGNTFPDDVGGSYSRSACELRHAQKRLRDARACKATPDRIRQYEQQVERWSYVGD